MTVARLSAEFHSCSSHFDARPDLFAPETFFDLLPPLRRFQFLGPGEAFTTQRARSPRGPVDVDVVGIVPTIAGFVTEHVETHTSPPGS